MATFVAQITGLTDLTISSSGTNPTEAQVTQYLRNGVTEVVNRIIKLPTFLFFSRVKGFSYSLINHTNIFN